MNNSSIMCYRNASMRCRYINCADCILDAVRKDVEALPKTYPFVNHKDTYVKEDDVRRIISKYRAESESE